MASPFPLGEHHYSHRIGWLRATVLGANDGILSTASLMIGVASAAASTSAILTAGLAGLVAGAMSMAAGEYVSVSSQADTEKADLDIERAALRDHPEAELVELAHIYMNRGVEKETAYEVARTQRERCTGGACPRRTRHQ
jgi:vacuolar iron transporter family protein